MDKTLTHLLIVDDDTRIRELLCKYLVDNGFIVSVAKSGADAREKLEEFKFDLLVVDVMMPGETGLEFTRWLKQNGNSAPVLMLTAMSDVEDRIAGLESGADDYLQKPFEPRELLLRIQKILIRTQAPQQSKIHFGNMIFDKSRLALMKNGADVGITTNEAKLLEVLLDNEGRVVAREEMAKICGGVNERTVDVQITRLRSKIEDNAKKPVHLKSVRGKGYVFYR